MLQLNYKKKGLVKKKMYFEEKTKKEETNYESRKN